MTFNDPRSQVHNFRRVCDRLLPHIVRLLPSCVGSLVENVDEDAITRNLVSKLGLSEDVRRFAELEYHFEPFRPDAHGNLLSTGQIDFIVRPLEFEQREVYVAYECKRLNVRVTAGTRSRATEYVQNGVHRFVTGQYAAGLPFGCMLGYVHDGRVSVANDKVRSSIIAQSAAMSMTGQPATRAEDTCYIEFETIHSRRDSMSDIILRHLLVSCVSR